MTPEVRRQLGAQRAEVRHLIVHEMRTRGYTGRALARLLGCSDVNVSRTINGQKHSPRVLDALRSMGVPEQYLFDPRCMGEPAALNLHRNEVV